MAKAIEQTPVLRDKEASRFLNILLNVSEVKVTPAEMEVHEILKRLPSQLKF